MATITDTMLDRAGDLGREHGYAAGSWAIDGDTSEADARALLAMIDDGDPALWDNYSAPLSGEWADGYSVAELMDECGATDDDDDPSVSEALAEEYDRCHANAWADEVERACRAILA